MNTKNRRFSKKKIRVLLAKAGLDGHDRGIKVIAMALRDAGMEVIYLGLRRTPEEIVSAALEEDVDVIGISLLSGAHTVLFPAVLSLMKKKKLRGMILIGGGIIPDEDQVSLRKKGVAAIFTPGAETGEIVRFIQEAVGRKAESKSI
ncbi:MAG TPA: cobalamin B12-binding domain-containing protein [Nitrospirota bacterium]|nr:cobalamin B12-binding domain-containing protein [Nitrospirota bacterium]